MQNIPVANLWYKGATALSGSFKNPCLMVLFINGYENFKKGCDGTFSRILKATHLEDTNSEVVESLVKAFILDLREKYDKLFNTNNNINKNKYITIVPTFIFRFDYYIDKAMILIKGDFKHSEIFFSFLNVLIDRLLEHDTDSLADNLGITDKDTVLNQFLDELRSWMVRAVFYNEMLKHNKVYSLKEIMNRMKSSKSTKHLMFIYFMFVWLDCFNYPLEADQYRIYARLFFDTVKLSIRNGDLFNQNYCYVILRDCREFFLKINYQLKKDLTVEDRDVSISLFEDDEEDIIYELNNKIDTNEFASKLYLACATYFSAKLHSLNGFVIDYDMIDPECWNSLSEEFCEFLKFYDLSPERIYKQLIKIKQESLEQNKKDIAYDVDILIQIIKNTGLLEVPRNIRQNESHIFTKS